MKKLIITILVCVMLAAGVLGVLAACGDDTIKLTVWGSAAQQATFEEMVEAFKQANPDKKYEIKVAIGEEDMAYSNVSQDSTAAADVYCYASDQLVPLLRLGALARLGGANLTAVKENNSAESVEAGSVGFGTADEKVYGYPYAADNGYFLYYDKSVLDESDVATLEGLISACETAGKKIGWAIDVPYYTAGFFFTFGCTYSVTYDDKFVETGVNIDFDNANGVKASKAIAKLTSSSAFAGKGTNNSTILTGFSGANRQLAVAVSGAWNAKAIKEALGSDYGVAKLPTVTVDGETKQMYSFKGYKLMGVNPHCKYPAEAHALAAFLTNEENQATRYEKHAVGPTNTAVANSDSVKNDVTLAVLNAQNAFAVPQTSVPSNFWEPLKNYGLNIMDGIAVENPDPNDDEQFSYQDRLALMVSLIKGTIK
ncbi:MAG: extracellular solute-binding protein [Clostridiales bacterium]|nr:extracellular solute-binding protein [Clostridiales bacterium]